MFGTIAARFLYPSNTDEGTWQFVTIAARMMSGQSMVYQAPSGERINVMRQADDGTDDDFVALSSTCPHLGCQVHWEPQNARFFCPCHSGVFSPSGIGISGPPEGQSLPRYPLKVEDGLLFIRVPTERLVVDSDGGNKAEG